jgi:hypothetical protein
MYTATYSVHTASLSSHRQLLSMSSLWRPCSSRQNALGRFFIPNTRQPRRSLCSGSHGRRGDALRRLRAALLIPPWCEGGKYEAEA